MGTKTITGCANRSTGAITFSGEACSSGDYSGCIERTGEHEGQIAITLSEVNCSDTYYGCIDRTTELFEVIIPDNCCTQYCTSCTGENLPAEITVTLAGFSVCGQCCWWGFRYGYVTGDVNGSYPAPWDSNCKWKVLVSDPGVDKPGYYDEGCTDYWGHTPQYNLVIYIEITATQIKIMASVGIKVIYGSGWQNLPEDVCIPYGVAYPNVTAGGCTCPAYPGTAVALFDPGTITITA